MGFGWLFIGYFISYMMSFTKYKAVIELLGCMIMWKGLDRLGRYNKTFHTAIYPLFGVIVVKLVSAVVLVDELFSMNLSFLGEAFQYAFEILNYLSAAAYHVFLLLAVSSITKDLELRKQNERASGNMVMTLLYYLFAVIWMLPLGMDDIVKGGVGLFLVIARILVAILNVALIYSCYMYICPVGDEDMPLKKSRFKFINDFREATDRRMQRAADENVRLYVEHRKKRNEKKKKRK